MEFPKYLGFGIKSSSVAFYITLSECIVWGNLLENTSESRPKAPKGDGKGDWYFLLHKDDKKE